MCAVKSDTVQKVTIDKKQVEEHLSWLDDVDSMKTQQIKQSMIKSLRYLNNVALSTPYRYQLMIKLYKQSNALLNTSEGDAKKARNSISVKLTRHLIQESINGYDIIIKELMSSGDPGLYQELLSQSFCHMLRLESRYLMEHYLNYEPISNDIWDKIKLLYRQALELKLASMPLYDKTGAVQTVEEAFIAVLLFAAINPFRLKQNEILTSYHILSEWAHQCRVEPCDDKWHSGGEWVICLKSDRPPEYLPLEQQPEETEDLLKINIDSILDKDILQAEKSDQGDKNSEHTKLKQVLLDRLRNGWTIMPPRSYERRRNFQEMSVAVGLKNCHQLLIDDEVQLSTNHSSTWSLHLANRWLEAEVEPQKRILKEINQIDVGIGGYGLSCPQQHTDKLAKGSLLLIRNADDKEKPWSVGKACWKQIYDDNTDSILGVSLLAKDAAPLIITRPKGEENSGGLLLPRGSFDNPLATLILPAEYQEGDTIECMTAHSQVKIELLKALKPGPDFQQFSYRVVA
ncbi:MAG: hypothetical protein L3J62_07500 [Gammaproteobacteria bacterium]|nr:hypothetical protein [Gammaproteobacteria bacterium]MCF6230621.1 hypothetical protein [Gammaproteobacteria bacterium]